MVDAPEKLWMTAEEMGWPGSFRSFRMSDLEHPEDEYPAYVRADLYEQVKRERDEARSDHEWMRDNRNKWQDATTRERNRAEAAERLAGARAVTDAMVEAALKSLHSNPVSWEHPETIRAALTDALAEPAGKEKAMRELIASYRARFIDEKVDYQRAILDTLDNIEMVLDGTHDEGPPLAEPAGEVEPRQFLPTEDGEFNGNTFSDDPVPFGWITQSAYDRVNYSSLPEEVTIIRNAVGPTGMPRVALYTTPPGASAIREALEAIRALSGLDGELCKASATIMSRMADIHQTADAALAGAKP